MPTIQVQPRFGEVVRTVLQVTSGNFLEMFDFFVYGFYASFIARALFPHENEYLALMMSLLTFGVGFLMRPLGAIVLGGYTDKHGRRKGLILSLSVMAAGILLIAFAPSYDVVGALAPCMVVTGRLLQGFSAGAEMGGGFCLLVRDRTVTPERPLRELAIGEPKRGGRLFCGAGRPLEILLVLGTNGRLGMARAVLSRLFHYPGSVHDPAQREGNRIFQVAEASAQLSADSAVCGRELEDHWQGGYAGHLDPGNVLPSDGVYSHLWSSCSQAVGHGQLHRELVRGAVEHNLGASRSSSVR
jgi:hypothetical protein